MKLNHKRILVTSALPYANGQIHIGHLVEYIQTDIWVRFLRMQNHEIYYIGADDTHGTPIMLRAQAENISPQELIDRVWHEHKKDFDDFLISFDHYGSTNSPENQTLSEDIYKSLRSADLIEKKSIEQAYDPVKGMFLPDRFIKGECPKCRSKDQYGDSCEKCGATYSPTDLINPFSVVSGATPIKKISEHYFFKLSDPRCEAFLRDWTQVKTPLQPEARNKMKEWVGEPGESKLSNWDISRDEPYFGFQIPDAPGKYFYVWLDAPIGYFASFKILCERQGLSFDEWVRPDSTTEMYHFIGKDILYFHTLFWPATLHFSNYRTPTNVFAHGFLTVDGEKMSKSRGTFITAKSFIDSGLNPEWLRYYFAAKLNASLEDLDLNLQDFIARVNSDLLGKYINIASRSSGFLVKWFGGVISPESLNHPLIDSLKNASPDIAQLYEQREFGKAQRSIMELADRVNIFVDTNKPWEIAKLLKTEETPESLKRLQEVCSVTLEAFRILTVYLKPVLPELAKNVEVFLNIEPLNWSSVDQSLTAKNVIQPYQHLMSRVDPALIERLIDANKSTNPVAS
ncbi:methionine--tRNA ligase [Polynucleobacter sp. SHI8]|uniref:methionine--tRNA ligase n=1 Tax=unclassified Polynucleobacter TaxID=2640945 RepID=UPI002492D2C7|nr:MULTISPECIES: methionine--tRNA ligase [unclassified Polynucleobacter]BDW10492.1 methionine--tRNA ligase [Polynucleobacter sp. SHI2]BDW12938.1 methionine--tRNA ligase [Polynucleobacter sp. SHI8]